MMGFRSSVDLRDDFRLDLSSRREEFASADIRAFFHSIYTHAIPWAIYGKDWSKRNRGVSHFGNMIDLLCRNSQDGQTIGLPVGPDTSRLIAEVIASAIDCKLIEKLKLTSKDASRYIDDYTISGGGDVSGEALISALRQAAAYFELELNNDKSEIIPTSFRTSTGWKQEIRKHIPPPGRNEYIDIQHFLYRVGQVCADHPDINVEKYAFQNARSAFIRAMEWKKVQSNLINAYRRNSSLISFLVEILILRHLEVRDVDMENVKEFVESRIPVLAQANRTGEIIWLLFLAIRLNIELSANKILPICSIPNAFIAILAANAGVRGRVVGDMDFELWNSYLNEDGLRSQMWLYAYEAPSRGLIPGVGPGYISSHPMFRAESHHSASYPQLSK